jgi:hypothetical protein
MPFTVYYWTARPWIVANSLSGQVLFASQTFPFGSNLQFVDEENDVWSCHKLTAGDENVKTRKRDWPS